MKYISEINAFYDWLELNPLPPPAIVLWHSLMSIANKTGWQQEFTVATSALAWRMGLRSDNPKTSAKTIERARNALAQAGRIEWHRRSGNQSAVYKLLPLCDINTGEFVAQDVAQSVAQYVAQDVAQSVAINRDRYRQDKENKKQCASEEKKQEVRALFEELWKLYPCKKGKGKVSYTQMSKLYKIGKEQLVCAIERYQADLKRDAEWRKPQNGSTFFNSGYVDYLDENYVGGGDVGTVAGDDGSAKSRTYNPAEYYGDAGVDFAGF